MTCSLKGKPFGVKVSSKQKHLDQSNRFVTIQNKYKM